MVGAGPAGLSAAAALRRYGVDVLRAGRLKGAALRASARDRGQHAVDGAVALLGARARDPRRRHSRGGVAGPRHGDPRQRRPGRGRDPRPADEGPGRRAEPHRAPRRAAGPHRGGPARLRPLAGAQVEFGREVLRVDVDDDGAEALVGNGERFRGRERPVRDRRRRRPQRGPERPRASRWAGPARSTPLAISAAFRAPLWDLVGEPRYGLYPIVHPEVSSVFVPSGRGDDWVFGVARRPDGAARRGGDHAPDPDRGGSSRPSSRGSTPITTFNFAAEIAERFAEAQRVPDRRRGAPRDPPRRHRDEHRDRRRPRPRLEAGLGPQRLGQR